MFLAKKKEQPKTSENRKKKRKKEQNSPTSKNKRQKLDDSTKPSKKRDDDTNKEKPCQICVSDLPLDVTEEQLREYFSKCGQVIDVIRPVYINNNKTKPRKYAFVTFSSNEESERAIKELNETILNGCKIRVGGVKKEKLEEIHKQNAFADNTIFVGNLSYEATEEKLEEEFSKCGTVLKISIPEDPKTKKKRGCAFIQFSTKEAVDKALKCNNSEFLGRKIRIELPGEMNKKEPTTKKKKKKKRAAKTQQGNKKTQGNKIKDKKERDKFTVFVGNLPFDTTPKELGHAFGECGKIVAVRIPKDPETNQPKGFAYVQFSSESEVQTACSYDGSRFKDRLIRVNPASKKT